MASGAVQYMAGLAISELVSFVTDGTKRRQW